MEIANTGNYSLLCKGWNKLVTQACMDAWELIVKNNSETRYKNYVTDLKVLNSLIEDYVVIKGLLLKLCAIVDDDDIAFLAKKGYKIDTSGKKAYAESIKRAMRKSDNLTNRANLKRNEIMRQFEASGDEKPETFDVVMADLIMGLEFNVDDNITLARYNELKKLVKEKLKARMPKGAKHK
jgi:hypothetical protein